MLKQIDYIVWQEGKYFVSQCLNVNVSSFGKSIDEAAKNLKEAVELYFEGETIQLPQVSNIFIGREQVNV
jgi:predicted RNase H-like HicB family nuclease